MNKYKIIIVITATILIIFIIYKNNYTKNEFHYSNIIANENNIEKEDKKINKIKVYVTGEIKIPKVIELEEGSRIEDAINKCRWIDRKGKFKKRKFGICIRRWTKIIYT